MHMQTALPNSLMCVSEFVFKQKCDFTRGKVELVRNKVSLLSVIFLSFIIAMMI